jgi:hypothetical protein
MGRRANENLNSVDGPDIEKISTGRHFQNGQHNTTQIQHYPISTTLHM